MAKIELKLTPKQMQIAVGVAIGLIGFGYVYYAYFWAPISEKIAKAEVDIDTVQAKIDKAKAQAARLPEIQRELVVLNQQAADAEKRLPKTKDLPAVLDTVSALGRKHRVALNNFTPGGQSAKQFFIEVPYAMVMTGAFHDIGRFFSALALEERIFNVRNVTYAGMAAGKLTVTFTLVSYQYKG